MSKSERAKILKRIENSAEYSVELKAALCRLYGLTPAQGFKTLVKAGIYTDDGKLTAAYKKPTPKVVREPAKSG